MSLKHCRLVVKSLFLEFNDHVFSYIPFSGNRFYSQPLKWVTKMKYLKVLCHLAAIL